MPPSSRSELCFNDDTQCSEYNTHTAIRKRPFTRERTRHDLDHDGSDDELSDQIKEQEGHQEGQQQQRPQPQQQQQKQEQRRLNPASCDRVLCVAGGCERGGKRANQYSLPRLETLCREHLVTSGESVVSQATALLVCRAARFIDYVQTVSPIVSEMISFYRTVRPPEVLEAVDCVACLLEQVKEAAPILSAAFREGYWLAQNATRNSSKSEADTETLVEVSLRTQVLQKNAVTAIADKAVNSLARQFDRCLNPVVGFISEVRSRTGCRSTLSPSTFTIAFTLGDDNQKFELTDSPSPLPICALAGLPKNVTIIRRSDHQRGTQALSVHRTAVVRVESGSRRLRFRLDNGRLPWAIVIDVEWIGPNDGLASAAAKESPHR